MEMGVFEDACVIHSHEWKLDLRRLSSGAALVALYQWLGHLVHIARILEELKSSKLAPGTESTPTAGEGDAVAESNAQSPELSKETMLSDVEVLLPLQPALSGFLSLKRFQGSADYEHGDVFPPLITIVTGWGKMSKQEGSSLVKALVQHEILKLRAPFKPSLDSGRWMITGRLLIPWLMNPATARRLALSDLAAAGKGAQRPVIM